MLFILVLDHNKKTLENYYDTLDEIFKKIKKCENGQENIKNFEFE